MTFILLSLTFALAALCVWLTVRVVNRRERWAKRLLAAVIGLPVLYVLSFGPACWMTSARFYPLIGPATKAPRIYVPIGVLRKHAPAPVVKALDWYATVGNAHSYRVIVPID
jgi:hypothetical protein